MFKNKGYEIVLKPYNETGYNPKTQKEDMRMFYITAYKSESLNKFDEQMVYFTQSPYKDAFDNYKKEDGSEMTVDEKKIFNYGDAFSRGCLRTGFSTQNGSLLFVYNLHSPVFGKSKEESSKIVTKDIQRLKKECPDAQFIINGDLNSFAEKGGDKHMEPFKKLMTFRDVSSHLISTATGKPVAATFTTASNDFGRFSGYPAIKVLEGKVCKESNPEKRSKLIGQMIKCAYFLALMEHTRAESRQRTTAEKKDMNDAAVAMAKSLSSVKDLIKNRLKLSPEKANKLLAESGYSVSGRAMDHGILIGDRLEQDGKAISNPHFTDDEYWKEKDLTPLEWLDYALEMNKARSLSDLEQLLSIIPARS
ncbi:hypothetical protein [Endozoicomonas ascidiicola]|uniref:hypothetical protein n=2 Tax=Endozoicomonas ascidiicola TaxID=1698521 RepID=UPI00082D79E9|nr:hypothetical protein [Endozoicomonas ascidiicola]